MEQPGFVDGLPDELALQRHLLARLLAWSKQDDDVCWLVIGCSIARGNADRLSDLDVGMGVERDGLAGAVARLMAHLPLVGDLVALYDHDFGLSLPHRRIVAVYRDRTMIDLVVMADPAPAAVAEAIVLYDPRQVVRIVDGSTRAPAAAEVYEWACLTWTALFNLGKYVRRQSAWEALRQLEEARRGVEQLWAADLGLEDARYGLWAIFDMSAPRLPDRFEGAVSRPESTSLRSSALYLAGVLSDVSLRLASRYDMALPDGLADFVVSDLTALADTPPPRQL